MEPHLEVLTHRAFYNNVLLSLIVSKDLSSIMVLIINDFNESPFKVIDILKLFLLDIINQINFTLDLELVGTHHSVGRCHTELVRFSITTLTLLLWLSWRSNVVISIIVIIIFMGNSLLVLVLFFGCWLLAVSNHQGTINSWLVMRWGGIRAIGIQRSRVSHRNHLFIVRMRSELIIEGSSVWWILLRIIKFTWVSERWTNWWLLFSILQVLGTCI